MMMMMMMNHKWRRIAIPKLENHSTSHPSKQRRLDFSASWINFCPTCCRTHAAMRPIMVIKEKTIATYGWSTYPPPGHLPDSRPYDQGWRKFLWFLSLMPAAKSLFLKWGGGGWPAVRNLTRWLLVDWKKRYPFKRDVDFWWFLCILLWVRQIPRWVSSEEIRLTT